MANINIYPGAVVIVSELKLEDIKAIEKYRPSALILKGGEDGKEPVFKIGTTVRSAGNINAYGAEFGGETHDEKKATVTLAVNGDTDEIRDELVERYGTALQYLNELEATLPAVLEEIGEARTKILDSISVF